MSMHVAISPTKPRIASRSGNSSKPTHTAPIVAMFEERRLYVDWLEERAPP